MTSEQLQIIKTVIESNLKWFDAMEEKYGKNSVGSYFYEQNQKALDLVNVLLGGANE